MGHRDVDGLLYFYASQDERGKSIVQVKGGGVKRNDVARLLAAAKRFGAAGRPECTPPEAEEPPDD